MRSTPTPAAALESAISQFSRASHLARAIGCTAAAISGWKRGKGKPSALLAMKIQQATGGKVKAGWLRPDLAEIFKS